MTSKYANKKFWIDTLDRAVSTTAQAAVASLTVSSVGAINWPEAGAIAALAGLVSFLQSIAFRGKDEIANTEQN